MKPSLPLDKMSAEEKIRTMEAIWTDLCQNADSIESPDWHGEILLERETAVERGEDTLEDWEAAKERIKNRIL